MVDPKKILQNASVCYKNAPGMEHGSNHVIVEMYTGIRISKSKCTKHRNQGTQPWETTHKLQAKTKIQKRRERASKGSREETKGHKFGKLSGSDKFEQSAKMQARTA